MSDKLNEIIHKIQSRISATSNRSVSLVELEVMRKKAVALEQRVERLEAERVYLFDIASVTMSAAKMLEEMEALASQEEAA